MQTYNKNDFRWLTLCRACFHALAHFHWPRKAWRTWLFFTSQYSVQMSNMAWCHFNFSDPRLVEFRGNGAVLAKLAAWHGHEAILDWGARKRTVLFRAPQSSIASWLWLESEGVIPVGASPNGWRTVEVYEIKKKNMSLFLTHKKDVMRGFGPEKKRAPLPNNLSLPSLPPVENIHPHDQLTSSYTLGDGLPLKCYHDFWSRWAL